jgi:hypothetical protein
VFDKVMITYRGSRYEIGRARDFYGIWVVGGTRSQPLQWWPETSEGWSAAWARFTEIEAPGTIVPVGRRTPPVPQVPAQAGQSPAQAAAHPAAANPAVENPAPAVWNPAAGAAASPAQATESPAQATESPALATESPAEAVESPATEVDRPAAVPAYVVGSVVRPEDTASVGGTGWGRDTADMPGAPAMTGPMAGVRTGGALVAAALLGLGVILGIVGLFPGYLGGSSLAQSTTELVPHAIYLAAWTASAVLIVFGGTRLRLGALLGTGLSVVTFGLFFADAGTVIADGAHLAGWGLWLSLAGWLACAAGSVLAFLRRPASPPAVYAQPVVPGRFSWRRPRGAELGPVVMLVLAGLGVAAAFAPSWDSYTLQTAAGQSAAYTAGNAFSNPGPVIAGNVAVMIALAVAVIVAAFWRPVRHGAVLLAGAAIPMAAQAISALIQVAEPAASTQFGISSGQATQLGLTIHSGVTPAFWVYCGFLIALVVSCAWMLFTPHAAIGSAPRYPARDDGYATWNPAAPGGAAATSAGSPLPAGSYSSTSTDTRPVTT